MRERKSVSTWYGSDIDGEIYIICPFCGEAECTTHRECNGCGAIFVIEITAFKEEAKKKNE